MTNVFTQVVSFEWKLHFKLERAIGKISVTLPTAAVKEDTNIFSSQLRKGFGLWSLTMAIQ